LGLKFAPGMSECLAATIEQLLAEAGLGIGQGAGFGEGFGPGFSARRGSAANMGLYGSLPALGPQGSGRGTTEMSAGPGSSRSLVGGQNPDEPAMIQSEATGSASGVGQGAIPLRYRQKVGQYLQRLAEELGK
jgi:hypothetical protein